MLDETVITPAGLARLTRELERLKTEREAVASQFGHALARDANGAEGADWQTAHEEEILERRIAVLEERISSAQLVEPGAPDGVVEVGERVRLRDLATGDDLELELVGPFEADPFAARISIASPMGRALRGLRRGDVAVVEAPGGTRRLQVVDIVEERRRDVA